jgi:translation initiation factor IF-3
LPKYNQKNQTATNEYIRAKELRVIGPEGENYGVIKTSEALSKARELELDLIEISPQANPPVAKIMDFGKYQYEQSKKLKAQKAKAHNVEVKSIQVKVATSENDLNIKAKRASSWLAEGHRIKLELFLPGRTKYLDENFLKDRLGRILKLLTVDYKIAEEAKKSPKGLTMIIEKSASAKATV